MFMKNTLALITLLLWPIIPLYWIPVHFATAFFRQLGRMTYLVVATLWVPLACLIFLNRELIIAHKIEFPLALTVAGLLLLAAGTLLHIWTATVLTLRGIIGIPELAAPQESKLTDKGPFAVVRHPTYLAHTVMFLGIFLFTGATTVGVLTVVDFTVISVIVIPLEERELLARLGTSYAEYMKKVPRLIPRIPRKLIQ